MEKDQEEMNSLEIESKKFFDDSIEYINIIKKGKESELKFIYSEIIYNLCKDDKDKKFLENTKNYSNKINNNIFNNIKYNDDTYEQFYPNNNDKNFETYEQFYPNDNDKNFETYEQFYPNDISLYGEDTRFEYINEEIDTEELKLREIILEDALNIIKSYLNNKINENYTLIEYYNIIIRLTLTNYNKLQVDNYISEYLSNFESKILILRNYVENDFICTILGYLLRYNLINTKNIYPDYVFLSNSKDRNQDYIINNYSNIIYKIIDDNSISYALKNCLLYNICSYIFYNSRISNYTLNEDNIKEFVNEFYNQDNSFIDDPHKIVNLKYLPLIKTTLYKCKKDAKKIGITDVNAYNWQKFACLYYPLDYINSHYNKFDEFEDINSLTKKIKSNLQIENPLSKQF